MTSRVSRPGVLFLLMLSVLAHGAEPVRRNPQAAGLVDQASNAKDPIARETAMATLAKTEAGRVTLLRLITNEANADTRHAAIRGLSRGYDGPDKSLREGATRQEVLNAIPAIIDAYCSYPDVNTARAAFDLVSRRIGFADDVSTALISQLTRPERNRREMASRLARGIPGPASEQLRTAMAALLTDENPSVRDNPIHWLGSLGRFGVEAALPYVTYKSSDVRRMAETRESAIVSIGEARVDGRPVPEAIDAIYLALTTDADRGVRNAAARALQQMGDVAAPVFRRAIADGDDVARDVLPHYVPDGRAIAKELMPLLDDAVDAPRRVAALRCLARVSDPLDRPWDRFAAMLDDPDRRIATAAARSLYDWQAAGPVARQRISHAVHTQVRALAVSPPWRAIAPTAPTMERTWKLPYGATALAGAGFVLLYGLLRVFRVQERFGDP